MNFCYFIFIKYHYYCVGSGMRLGKESAVAKPTTAELEPQGTSVWIHVVNAAGRDQSDVIKCDNQI